MDKFSITSYFRIVFLVFLFFLLVKGDAQGIRLIQPDSLYDRFISYRNFNSGKIESFSHKDDLTYIKCGFGLVSQIKFNFDRFTASQKKKLTELLDRPQKDTSIVSPSGFFRIHFDREGFDVPNYDPSLTADENALQVALAADSAYYFEVNYLGFPPPPSDIGETDGRYDIYIGPLGGYGETVPELPVGNHVVSSFINIHFQFQSGFFTHGLNAMRVTVAHELHHAIQIGNYSYDSFNNDPFFYEMTSTSMEEFVFDDVNDYYGYLGSYFADPGRRFNSFRGGNDGYDIAIWNLYLQIRFGFEIIKRQWELLPDSRAMDAINTSIFERGSSFQKEFNTFGVWMYFTKDRFEKGAEQGFSFEEGNKYPLVNFYFQQSFTPPYDEYNLSSFPVSNNFARIFNGSDTIVVIITNSNIKQADDENNPNLLSNFTYGLYDNFVERSKPISNLYLKTESSDPLVWTTLEVLNDSVNNNPAVLNEKTASVFPMPFVYGKNGDFIRFSVGYPKDLTVDFYVYTIGLELVYSGPKILDPSIETGSYVVSWIPSDNKNRKLASGVYLYIIKSGDNIKKGKFVVFNR